MPKAQVGAAANGESRIPLKTIRGPAERAAGSHAGSHTDEQPSHDPDPPGQPEGTSPRSRTDLNGTGCPYGNLRIRTLGVQILRLAGAARH